MELELQAEILSMIVTRPCFEEEYKFERLTHERASTTIQARPNKNTVNLRKSVTDPSGNSFQLDPPPPPLLPSASPAFANCEAITNELGC